MFFLGSVEACEMLIKAGANLNHRDKDGLTGQFLSLHITLLSLFIQWLASCFRCA